MRLPEENYHGFRIQDEPDQAADAERQHWFNVFDETGVAFRLVFGVKWDFALAYPDLGHPRDAAKILSEQLGRRWVHGLIDLDLFQRGTVHEEVRTEESRTTVGTPPRDEDLRLELLQALRRMARAEKGGTEIFVLDVDGVADVLGVTGLRLRGILGELLAESLVEPYAATFGSGPEDGSCRITGLGLTYLRAAQTSEPTPPLPVVESPPRMPPVGDPCIFVSYDSRDIDMALFVAQLIEARLEELVFVAKRDIEAGAHPLKTMLEQRLPGAVALVALCSRTSKTSPWLWWETSSVWTRGELVLPLFVDISANEFGGPITLVTQGRSVFDAADLGETLRVLVAKVSPGTGCPPLNEKEEATLRDLEAAYDKRVAEADPQRERRFSDLLSLILDLKDAALRASRSGERWSDEIATIESKLGTLLKLLDGEPFPPQVSEYCRAPMASMVIGQWQLVHSQVEAVMLSRAEA